MHPIMMKGSFSCPVMTIRSLFLPRLSIHLTILPSSLPLNSSPLDAASFPKHAPVLLFSLAFYVFGEDFTIFYPVPERPSYFSFLFSLMKYWIYKMMMMKQAMMETGALSLSLALIPQKVDSQSAFSILRKWGKDELESVQVRPSWQCCCVGSRKVLSSSGFAINFIRRTKKWAEREESRRRGCQMSGLIKEKKMKQQLLHSDSSSGEEAHL